MLTYDAGVTDSAQTVTELEALLTTFGKVPAAYKADTAGIASLLGTTSPDRTDEAIAALIRLVTISIVGGLVAGRTAPRTVSDAVFNSSTTVTSTAANFTSADYGATFVGTGVPAGTLITAVVDEHTITLSHATTTTGTDKTATITGTLAQAVTSLLARVAVLEAA